MRWAQTNRGGGAGNRRSREYLLRKACIEALERRLLLSQIPSALPTFAPTFINLGSVPIDGAHADTLTAPFTPAQIVKAYGTNLINFSGTPGNGAGQTIAIVDAFNDPDIVTDAQAFSAAFGLPAFVTSGSGPTLTVLNQNGTTTLPGNSSPGDWDIEESLDVEWAHTVAPQANIILFESNSDTYTDLLAAVTQAAGTAGVSDVSMSWGGTEFSGENASDSTFTTPAKHPGVTFITSAGDSGAIPQYPSVSPNVISVGGTSLTINNDGTYGGETAWSGGGGGLSAYESQPTYQVGKVNGVTTTARATPDVSWLADPDTGVLVLDSYDTGPGFYLQIGGTSLAAPMWAGLISIANQDRALDGLPSLDGVSQVLPTLYKLASKDFNDITSGNNDYPAGPGYDLATGLGTPIPSVIANDIAFLDDANLQVISSTPASGGLVVGTAPTDFSVTLLDAVNPATVQTSDFTVNGIHPSTVSVDSTDTIISFHFNTSPVTTQGTQTLSIPAGVMNRASDNATNLPYSANFKYVVTQLQVVSTNPAAGSVSASPLSVLNLNFNEAIDPTSVNLNNLVLSQGSVTGYSILNSNTTVQYTLSEPAGDGTLNVAMASTGGVLDLFGVGTTPFSANYITDIPVAPFPTPLTSVAPLGSLVYTGSVSRAIQFAGDSDSFTISLDPGQTLTATVTGASTLQPILQAFDPTSTLLGSSTAATAGAPALLQTLPVNTSGTYTLTVTSAGGTLGNYTLALTLNAAVKSANFGGTGNISIATAQSLDGGFETLAGSAAVASVAGAVLSTSPSPIPPDYYSFTLAAGQDTTLGATTASGTISSVLLENGSGTVLASSTSGATNLSQVVSNFVAPSAGVYYAVVNGTAGSSYNLLVTRGASFDTEPNGLGHAQPLGASIAALGDVSATGGTTIPTNPGTPFTGAMDFFGTPLSIGIAADGSYTGPTVGFLWNGIEFLRWGTYLGGVTVAVNGVDYTDDIAAPGGTAFPVTMQNFSSGTLHGIRINGTINTTLGYQRTIWWNDGDSNALVYTTLTNLGTTTLTGIATLENQDPDPGGNFVTNNDVVVDSNGQFIAGSVAGVGTMAMGSDDPRAVASVEPFFENDPFAVIDAPQDPNGAAGDNSINMAFNIGTLAPGQSTSVGYTEIFGLNQPATQAAYDAIATKTASSTPDDDYYSIPLSAGQTIGLRTSTPGDGSGQFVNTLDPALDVYDPNGNLVATNDNGAPDGRNAMLSYTAPTAGTYSIRVYAVGGTKGEYVLSLGDALSLSLPANVTEGVGTVNATITATKAPTSALTIAITSSDPSRLSVPATVVLPAGQMSVTLPLTVIDDTLLNGPESVSISASATGYFSGSGAVEVHDNETATLSVALPASATEGVGTIVGTITSTGAPTRDLAIQLTSSNPARLTVPATVILKAGQLSATFNANVIDDTLIDGNVNVTVSASFENWTTGSTNITVQDNDNTIAVAMPASGWEGQTLTGAGTIQLGGTAVSAITVNLSSGDPSELSVPASVIVAAGQSSATFTLTLLNDGLKDGTQTATVYATATGLTPGNATIAVHDSNLDHLAFTPIATTETVATPFAVTIDAYNVANEIIPTFSGTVSLTAAGTNGPVAFAPDSVNFTAGVWTGNVTVSTIDPGVTLTANAGGGITAASNKFAVVPGSVAAFQWSSISSPQTIGTPFAATITAKDSNGFTANFNGSVNLSGLVGGVNSQDMLGNLTAQNSSSGGPYTLGYQFTPNTTLLVTAVRSYFGSKVDIWTNSGTLLTSQAVSAAPGVWTQTPLSTPITLSAGTTYIVSAYVSGAYYWDAALPAPPSFTTFGQGYYAIGDGFPTLSDNVGWLVDLQVNVGGLVSVPITPTTATFLNGAWSGNITVTQAAMGVHLHASDAASHVGDSNAFNVSPLAPAAPVLLAASDTGISSSDGLTDLNNSTPASVLQFSVGSTVAGATVTIYANGKAIGSAVATGTTTSVTTDGVTGLADGPYTITAKQDFLPDPASAASAGSSITIDTVTPVAAIAPVVPNPRTLPVSSLTITFSKPVFGLTLSGLSLTENGGGNLLTSSQTLTTSDGITWTLGNLAGLTGSAGAYTLSLAAGAAQSSAGDLCTSAAQSWETGAIPVVASFIINGGAVQRSMDTLATVVFNEPVLLTSAITITQRATGGGTPTPVVFTQISPDGGTTWNLTFPSYAHNTLPDGIYDLVVNAAGVTAAATGFAMPASQTFTFHRLFGDFDGNGTVNNADYFQFKKAYGQTIGSTGYNALFDFDGNGIVNNGDYFQFKLRYGVIYTY
jgi:hypothetical protein